MEDCLRLLIDSFDNIILVTSEEDDLRKLIDFHNNVNVVRMMEDDPMSLVYYYKLVHPKRAKKNSLTQTHSYQKINILNILNNSALKPIEGNNSYDFI